MRKRSLQFTVYSLQKKTIFLVSGFWLLVTLIAGCGYTTRSFIHSQYKKIYIQPFTNKIDITTEASEHRRLITYYPLLETNITSKVIEQFILDGNLRVVREEGADCVLESELIDFRRDTLRYTETDEPKEYRLTLAVNLSLWTKNKEKIIWQEKNFLGDTTYFVTGSLAKSEISAIDDAIKDLARRIVERTVEEW